MAMTVERLLNSIGKRIFVKYYYNFKSQSRSFCISSFEECFTDKAKSSRTGHAFSIFRNGLEKDALQIIANSDRVDDATRKGAKEILMAEFHQSNITV